MIRVLDSVLAAIGRDIAAHPPERGGALLGFPDTPTVTTVIFDGEAETTGVTYRPSLWLAEEVRRAERNAGLAFAGIVHSHPGGMDHPSGPDEWELATGLALNPHMARYLLPIVTAAAPFGPLQAHELPAGGGKVSFFGAIRAVGDRRVRAVPVTVKEIPMLADLNRVRVAFEGAEAPEVFPTDIQGVPMIAGRLRLDGLEIMVLAGDHYPALAPLFLITSSDGVTDQAHAPWSLALPPEERLLAAVRSIVTGRPPYRRVFGLPNLPALTTDPVRARRAGWADTYSGQDPVETVRGVQDGLFARSAGLLTRDLAGKTVLLAGAGSGGSYAGEMLVRSGVGRIVIVDPEPVEADNLSRAAYGISDIGLPKPEALARRLMNINPGVEVECHTAKVQEFTRDEMADLVGRADLVYGGTDDGKAQLLLNQWAFWCGKPALYAGLYAGARGGEVIVTVPGRTPCYLCATRLRHAAERTNPVSAPTDYGTGRLVGEMALGADVHHVESAAVKIALSLLLPPGAEARLKDFLEPQLATGATYLTLSMTQSFWFYPAIFGTTPGQGPYQAVWMTPEYAADCPICGEVENRTDPRAAVRRAPRFNPDLLRKAGLSASQQA